MYPSKEEIEKATNLNGLLPVEMILKCLKSDLLSYAEFLENIEESENYFTINESENHKYWSDWFNGSDMNKY